MGSRKLERRHLGKKAPHLGRRVWNENLKGREVESSALGCPERCGHTRWAEVGLTIIVNEEGGVGREDLIVADLAVLGRTVTVDGFHP